MAHGRNFTLFVPALIQMPRLRSFILHLFQLIQNPRSSATRNTLIRPVWPLRLVITSWLQKQSGDRQSPHFPVAAQGV